MSNSLGSVSRLLTRPIAAVLAFAVDLSDLAWVEVWSWSASALLILPLIAVGGATLLAFFGLAFSFSVQRPIPVGKYDKIAMVHGSRVRYRRIVGKGPPIVLVHGYKFSIDDWEPVISRLSGREIFALDLVGYGGSDRPTDVAYDVAYQHRHVVRFLDVVGVKRAVLVGHSTGAAVVVGVAAQSPERVLGSVLIAPAGVPGALVYRWPKSLVCRAGIVNRFGFRLASTALFRRVFPFHLVRQHLGLLGSFNDGYLRTLDNVQSPMMLIWSSGDRRCLAKYADVYRARVRDVDVRLLPHEVGHMAPMVEPVMTAELIREFVDKLGREPS